VSVIYLDVPDEELVERGTGRRVHPSSGRTYHMRFRPPKTEGRDDLTGEPLVHRDDDKEEVIKKRLLTFHENNGPMLQHYEKLNIVWKIKGNESMDKVWTNVDSRLAAILPEKALGAEPVPVPGKLSQH